MIYFYSDTSRDWNIIDEYPIWWLVIGERNMAKSPINTASSMCIVTYADANARWVSIATNFPVVLPIAGDGRVRVSAITYGPYREP